MNDTKYSIIENYKYIVERLNRGYKEDLDDLIRQIMFENFQCGLDNTEYIKTTLFNSYNKDNVTKYIF